MIPLSEVAAKEEFLNIKNVSRDDIMAAHRVPAQMMDNMPNNARGFDDIDMMVNVFMQHELIPLPKILHKLNDWIGINIIKSEPCVI